MSEQNPSDPIELAPEAIVVEGERADEFWKGGTLRLGHWVSVTVYRFPDMRNPASPGGALPLGGKGDNSARTYGAVGTYSRQVFTFKAESDLTEPGMFDNPQFVGPIKSVRTTKRLGPASGQFTIVTKPFAEWTPIASEQSPEAEVPAMWDPSIVKYVDSGDWIEIVAYKSDPRVIDSPVRTLLVGKVDTVHLNIQPIQPGGGAGSSVRIEGRDIGAVYEDTVLYFNPYDPLHSNPEGRDMAKIVTDISGAPGDIVRELLGILESSEATFGLIAETPDAGLWTTNPFSQPIAFTDTVVDIFTEETRGTVFDPSILSPGQATPLWDFATTYSVPELNEVWLDTIAIEGGPQYDGDNRYSYLFIREKPFVNTTDGKDSPWFFINESTVHIGEIKQANLSRGDNRYNYVNVLIELPPNLSYDAFVLCQPVYNMKSIKRHGLLKLDMTLALNMIADGETDSLAVSDQIRELRDLVVCWNLLNAYYYEGSIVLAGIRADIRVGKKVVIEGGPVPHMQYGPFTPPAEGFERAAWGDEAKGVFTAYVEQVEYNWTAGVKPQATTTITVSRGYRDDLRLEHMKLLAKDWSGVLDAASATATSDTVYSAHGPTIVDDGRPE